MVEALLFIFERALYFAAGAVAAPFIRRALWHLICRVRNHARTT